MFVVPVGAMKESVFDDLNKEFKNEVVVMSSGGSTHMFNGSTNIDFLYRCATKALDQRRLELNAPEAKALIVCDRCTATFDNRYFKARKAWSVANNAITMGNDVGDTQCDVRPPPDGGLAQTSRTTRYTHFCGFSTDCIPGA